MDIETDNLERRIALWELLERLKSIIQSEEYLPEAIFEDSFVLQNGKEISRVYVQKLGVSIHNKNTWQDAMVFLNEKMKKFEIFFEDYKEVLTL